MKMQRGFNLIGLLVSIALLLGVYAYALLNPHLFIDTHYQHVGSLPNDENVASGESQGAKISGLVINTDTPKYIESQGIEDNELAALKQDQWLQGTAPESQEARSQAAKEETGKLLDKELAFAPERPSNVELANVLETEQESTRLDNVNEGNISENGTENTSNESAEASVLEQLQAMSFVDIRFQFGQQGLSQKALRVLEKVAEQLKKNNNISAKIMNYTDSYGDDSFNLELSRQRAKVIHDVLLEQGVNARQLSYEGLGESSPIASNTTLEGRRKNRRTEIQFVEAN